MSKGNGTIEERFQAFHAAHPFVFDALVRLAREAKARGCRRIGAKALWERARWDLWLEVGGEPYRLNNDFTSRYARLIADTHPELAPLFEFRALTEELPAAPAGPGEAA